MVERAFDQRLWAWFTIFFEQILFQRPGIHTDADRAAIGLGGVDDFVHPFCAADITGVNPQTCCARICCLERTFIVEMDIGNDGDLRGANNLFQRCCALHIGAGYTDDIDACILAPANLVNGRLGIAGQRVGHGLHRNRRIATDGYVTDHDLAGLTTRYIAPWAYGRHEGDIGRCAAEGNWRNAGRVWLGGWSFRSTRRARRF